MMASVISGQVHDRVRLAGSCTVFTTQAASSWCPNQNVFNRSLEVDTRRRHHARE